MTYVRFEATRVTALLAVLCVMVLASYSAAAQQKQPVLKKEPEKVEEQKPAAPNRTQTLERLPKDKIFIPDRVPKKPVEPDCSGTETVRILPFDMYPLLPVRGDTELGGSPDFELSASITHTVGRILIRGYVELDEWDRSTVFSSGGDTTFRGNFSFDSIVLKAGCEIDTISPVGGKIQDFDTNHHNWETFYGAGLIESANCRLDTGGDDEGRVGCKDIRLRPIKVSFRKQDQARICRNVSIQPRTESIFPLYSTRRGDRYKDMDGNRVDVFIDSSVRIADTPDGGGQEVLINTDLRMSEVHDKPGPGMKVYGEGGQRNVFLTAFDAPGCKLVTVQPGFGSMRGKSGKDEHDVEKYETGSDSGWPKGIIDYANCRTDTKGDDSGKIGCTEVVYRKLNVMLEPK